MTKNMGRVFDIQRFSVHDGPGIRTTFFLKGCPLRCKWCHNPEGLSSAEQLQYVDEKCIMCGNCKRVCKENCHIINNEEHLVDFNKCKSCFECVSVCPSKALDKFGISITPEDVLENAQSDMAFYGEQGGVTFSGGEATMQINFLQEALKICKANGITTAVDTSGYTSWENYEKIIPYTDIFLYDIKAVSNDIHIDGTGVSNDRIIDNFKKLIKNKCRIWVRTPVIQGFNASIEEMSKIADLIAETKGVEQVELMPYHKLGRNKYYQIGLDYPCEDMKTISNEDMQDYVKIFKDMQINIVSN